MERRKMDLPDYFHRRDQLAAQAMGMLMVHEKGGEGANGTYSISYALPFGIARELRGLAPRGDGCGSKDLFDGERHCSRFCLAI
jgi:hypothetical protein